MYRAKPVGPNGLQIFDEAIAQENSERAAMAHDLRNALACGALSLAYQPRLSLETGLANGFEALVRWDHPKRGSVSPALFVPIAEENGLITRNRRVGVRTGLPTDEDMGAPASGYRCLGQRIACSVLALRPAVSRNGSYPANRGESPQHGDRNH